MHALPLARRDRSNLGKCPVDCVEQEYPRLNHQIIAEKETYGRRT